MADDRRLSADEVASRAFATSFRGLDPNDVRSFLKRVAEELAAAYAREDSLAVRLKEAEQRADHPEVDEDTLLRVLGDETTRVMRAAREAAADLKARAEESVEQILRDAHDEAKRTRAAADSVLAERSALAEQEAASVLEAARGEADAVIAMARAEADTALEEVRGRAKEMVVEAQAARERILADLARRRRVAHVQVEQLRAGRDRLLDAYRMVRSTLEEVTDELQKAEQEARQAAEATARRLAGEDAAAAAAEVSAPEPEPAAPEPESPAISTGPAPVEIAEEPSADEGGEEGEEEQGPMLVSTTIEADSPAPVTAEPSRPASMPVEERRLSSLKVIRRESEPDVEPETVAEVSELTVLEPPANDEGVRILAPVAAGEVVNKPAVDDVFAKLRASREEAVAKAREVLADEPADEEAPVSNNDERALQERDEAVADVEHKLARRIKRSLQDEQNDVLDRLRSAKTKTAESVLPSVEDHVARHAGVATPFLQEVGKGVDVASIATELAEAVVHPLRRSLERAFEGGDNPDVEPADRVGMAYREWKADRIERLAGDAVIAAWSRAAYSAVPDGATLRWVVDDQGAACPDCDDNALAGPTAKGDEYPTGQQHPPAHAGCRCLLVRAAT